jgi:hypothetical protein
VQVRSIILGAVGALVLIGFLMVVMDSEVSSGPKVDDAEMEKALSSYKRNESRTSANTSAPRPSIPRARAKTQRDTTEEDSAPEKAPYTAPAPEEESSVFVEKADLKTQMNDANALYDKADYEAAREAALAVLSGNPNNVRMQRIVVSSSCIMGEEDLATEHYQSLPQRDQRQMARRCKRYGIDFEEAQ